MSKDKKLPQTLHQRAQTALENIELKGRRAHEPFPKSVEARRQAVQRGVGILDENGRYPATVGYARRLSHGVENDGLEKKRGSRSLRGRVAVAAAVTVVSGGVGVAAGLLAPDAADPPHPGNMTEFNGDPLQNAYNENPQGHEIVGGRIAEKGTEIGVDTGKP